MARRLSIIQINIRLLNRAAKYMKATYTKNVWTDQIGFYLDGTGFAYKRNPLDQATAPKARVWRKNLKD